MRNHYLLLHSYILLPNKEKPNEKSQPNTKIQVFMSSLSFQYSLDNNEKKFLFKVIKVHNLFRIYSRLSHSVGAVPCVPVHTTSVVHICWTHPFHRAFLSTFSITTNTVCFKTSLRAQPSARSRNNPRSTSPQQIKVSFLHLHIKLKNSRLDHRKLYCFS